MDDIDLLNRWREGDQQAATDLYNRYAARLMRLVANRLSDKFAQRLDPEDVVQSVCRTFFAHARAGDFVLQRSGDLWQLLMAISLNKIHRQVRNHARAKRNVARELHPDRADPGNLHLNGNPGVKEALALAEVLERLRLELKPVDHGMIELRLQGYTVVEIAARTQRCERTVWRVLGRVKCQLEQWYQKEAAT